VTLPRIALVSAVVLAALLVCLGPHDPAPAATIPARELLNREQRLSGASYTFDRTTSEALAATRIERPSEDADSARLLASLRAAGFELRDVGVPDKKVFVVEKSGS